MQALVVGASGLLGRHIAVALARPGWSLRLHHHRHAERTEALAADLRSRGVVVTTVEADLYDPAAAEALLDGLSTLDVLVHSAGSYTAAPLEALDAGALDTLWALNVRAPLLVASAAAGALTAAAAGQLIWLTDIAASQPWRGHVAYAASRAAQEHAVRCLALELAGRVRVNAVAPGLVRGAAGVDARRFGELEARIPSGRAVDPEEVAQAVRMLVDGPTSITGQIITVDGGRRLGRRART